MDIQIAHKSRVSISYDVQKVDDMTAAEFMHKLKGLLDDPELLLLWAGFTGLIWWKTTIPII